MLVIVALLGVGGGLVLGGLRRAVHYWLAHHNKDHAVRLAKRTGQPAGNSLRPAFIRLAMLVVGVVMMATIDTTAEALRPMEAY